MNTLLSTRSTTIGEKWTFKMTQAPWGKVWFKSIVVRYICTNVRRWRGIAFGLWSQSIAAVYVCSTEPQHGVELLCASFCYVMRNQIRRHLSAGQAWHPLCFVVAVHLLLPSCPVHLLPLSLILHPLVVLATAYSQRKSTSRCVNSCLQACPGLTVHVSVWISGAVHMSEHRGGLHHTSTDSCKVKGCFSATAFQLFLFQLFSQNKSNDSFTISLSWCHNIHLTWHSTGDVYKNGFKVPFKKSVTHYI